MSESSCIGRFASHDYQYVGLEFRRLPDGTKITQRLCALYKCSRCGHLHQVANHARDHFERLYGIEVNRGYGAN